MNITNIIYITNYTIEPINLSTHCISYSLEEAVEVGLQQFRDSYKEKYDNEPTPEQLQKFVESELRSDDFMINVISGNRLRFNTSDELITYFLDHISEVKTENLYKFLLSFIECDNVFYNYKGEYIGNDLSTQCPSEERCWDSHVSFSKESCAEGKYKFIYNNKGINTF
jgi:hypothetical protein